MTDQPATPAKPTHEHALSVEAVPAFSDNYLWLIHNGRDAAVVDPGDATPIKAALQAHGLTLVAILLTHHHADHVGGVLELVQAARDAGHPPLPVYGPAREKIAGLTHPLHEGDQVTLNALPLSLQVIDVPGHTLGHIAYYAKAQDWLFCGDTLFAGGCGRLFEGTPAQMVESLGKLAALPTQTAVYCAHEYTLSNLRFALAAEPGNAELAARFKEEQSKRERNIPTVPSSIGVEINTNPFLRYTENEIMESMQKEGRLKTLNAIDSFAALREWKNTYK